MVRIASEACFRSPAPMQRAQTADTPIEAPTEIAVTTCCIGNASETEVSACSEMRATNIESTMLYMAWMKKETIIGRLIFNRTLWTGSFASMVMRAFLSKTILQGGQ